MSTFTCVHCGREKPGAKYRDDLLFDVCAACQAKPPLSAADLTPEERARLLKPLEIALGLLRL